MRIYFLIALLFFFTHKGQTQVTKGFWLIGGKASIFDNKTISGGSSLGEGQFNLNIAPNIGYFLIDNLAGGIRGRLDYVKFGEGANSSTTSYGFGPFVRYYFLPSAHVFNVLLDASYDHTWTSNSDINTYTFSAGPAFFFNQSVALETLLGYSISSSNIFTNRNLFFSIGFQIHLEREK